MMHHRLGLLAVLLVVHVVFGNDHNVAPSTSCANLPPGLQRMARGIDLSSLDLFPTDISLTNGFRQSLFDFTCNSNKKWSHPTVANFEFSVPDQISAVNTVPGGEMNHKVKFHQDIKEYKKSLGVQVGLDVNTVAYGDYSLSVGYKRAQEEIMNMNRTIVEVSAYVSAIQMDVKPFYELKPNKNFQDYVEKLLPSKYEDAPELYQEFLNTFGTHYFESGMFGGYMLQRTEVENYYLYQTDDKEVTTNVEISYLKMMGLKVSPEHQDDKKSTLFDKNSMTSYYYYGGQTNLAHGMNQQRFAEWWDSVPKDPWLFGGRIKPIEHLITNAQVKKEMQKALYVKFTRAYLQELKDTVRIVRKFDDDDVDEIDTIDKLLKQKVPNKKNVTAIKEKVEAMVAQDELEKERSYLEHYYNELNKLMNYELLCKKEVTLKCDHEKSKEVMDDVATVTQMLDEMKHLLSAKRFDHRRARNLAQRSIQMIEYHQSAGLGRCREVLICNICKVVIVDIVKRKPCDTTHIKKLVDVHI